MAAIDRRVNFQASNYYMMDRAGMGVLLNSEMLRAPVVSTANRIKDYAQFLAAGLIYTGELGFVTTEYERRHQTGMYLSSFKVKSQRNGGVHNDRVEAIVYNDAPSAFWVEFGHHGREPFRIMARASFEMKGGRRP
jgi:hypothetical protein